MSEPQHPDEGYVPPPQKPARQVSLASAIAGGAVAALVGGTLGFVYTSGSDTTPVPVPSASPSASTPAATTAPTTTEPTVRPPATPGETVRDGSMSFVVHAHVCGREVIASSFNQAKAQGEFCLIELTVLNIGKEPITFDPAVQIGLDESGLWYSPSPKGEEAANWESDLYKEMQPGDRRRGYIVFDVPKGTRLTQVELHESVDSRGVIVDLT